MSTSAKIPRESDAKKLLPFPGSGPRKIRRLQTSSSKPYSLFTIKPLSPTIGVEISDIDLAQELTPQLHSELHRALLEWKVLFFRDQNINYKQHISFAKNWGNLEIHPFYAQGDAPEVIRFHRKGGEDKESQGYENEWHSDTSFRENPSLGAVLRCIECPQVGGDTSWADMYAAYDNLPPKLQSYLETLTAEHDVFNAFQDTPENRKKITGRTATIHPIIRVHPDTKRKLLYVNKSFTTKIIGLHPHDSDELLHGLLQQAMVPEYHCRFRWAPKSIAFWDNRATQHYANSDYFPATRIMERVTIIGERPIGVSSPSKL